jgi:uncharacterized protein YutE (UPF0331/DUF86 family)
MRITDKIDEIEKYLEELSKIMPQTLVEYQELKTRAVCERYFEKIIEAVVDLAFLVIKFKSLKIPEDDKSTFNVLLEAGIIPGDLSEKLKEAKGMRNLLAHKYGYIDDEIVFESITEELEKYVSEFIKKIKNKIK